MTSKARVQKFREKLKNNEEAYQLHLETERKRDKKRREMSRKSMTDNPKLNKLKKQSERERKQRYRMKKNEQASNSPIQTYKSASSLGKAVSRTKKALPKSPNKRRAVVKKLLSEYPDIEASSSSRMEIPLHGNKVYTEELISHVQNFFSRDDISRCLPGKRDSLVVRDTITKEKCNAQKRIMLTTVMEAYELFKSDFPHLSTVVKKSKFFDLRPTHVLPTSKMPHNVCICKYHANMEFLVKCLSDKIPSFPNTTKILVSKLVCTTDNEKCMAQNCVNCKLQDSDPRLINLVGDSDMYEEVCWKQWKEGEVRVSVVSETGSVDDVLQEIAHQLPVFTYHCFVKQTQSHHFQTSKSSMTPNAVVLQIDFSENYTLSMQDEIQSAHWSHDQVTIFTAVAWLVTGSESMVVVSDELNHGKHSVWTFLLEVIKFLKTKHPQINELHIFSDGCAAQFKNKFTLTNMTFLGSTLNITSVDWSFFATAHGKGAVDGVGGSVKRAVWNRVKSKSVNVLTAEDFADCARHCMKSTKVIYVPKESIAENIEMLEQRLSGVCPIPKLQSLHYFSCVKEGLLEVGSTAKSELQSVVTLPRLKQQESEQLNISVGDFVEAVLPVIGKKSLVTRSYMAEVKHVDNKSVTLLYMEKSGKFWIWPAVKDESIEDRSVVKRKLCIPTLVNNRGQFSFE